LIINKKDGAFTLKDASEKILSSGTPLPDNQWGSFGVHLNLAKDERIYGLGDVSRDCIQRRGKAVQMWATYGPAYAPSPFVMSSRNYGLFVNTTWRHYWDIGRSKKDVMTIWGPQGDLDFYLMAGKDYAEILNLYTEITGKPTLLPMKSYGLMYIEHYKVDQYDLLRTAEQFRSLRIPCDWLGLEPGWMEKNYDLSTTKDWHPDRFFMPSWGEAKDHREVTFIGALNRMGFDLELWIACNYDISYEAERRALKAETSPAKSTATAPFEVESLKYPVHGHEPWHLDNLTKPDEPWFQHLKRFVDFGVAAFKQDPAFGINEHPDRLYGNGMTDEEMHNLYQTLLAQQYHEGFREHTGGRRSATFVCAGYAGLQRWAPTWAGDTGGGPGPLISMLNHGMSGHINTSCDMEVTTPAGIHFGFFQTWALVNGWFEISHPWRLGQKQYKMFVYYDKLRYRLIPYIYSTAFNGHLTGMPVMRAMPLVFPNDPKSDELLNQYMFGDYLLVSAFSNRVHLPQGNWIDYWTGKTYQGPVDIDYMIPENRGGALFVKAGAILPQWPEVDYIEPNTIKEIILEIFPHERSSFSLYEDDGKTYAYEKGAFSRTNITCEAAGTEVRVNIPARQGDYEGKPKERRFLLQIHLEKAPTAVTIDGRADDTWRFDEAARLLTLPSLEEKVEGINVTVKL
ncbi:MAG: DUF5110 domain-containing protein, partial [candidate division KSB1 bacterium]|nr:DUF5110 domain-containing protein [candidate division KSB1 bacterium]